MSEITKEYITYNRKISNERKESGFTGIFIPLEFLEFKKGTLSWIEMAILSEIKYLCIKGKYKKCIVNNQHFMDTIGVSEKTVQRALSHLSVLDAITINGNNSKRTITFNSSLFEPKYSEIEYNDSLSDTPTISRDTPTISRDTPTYCLNSSLYEENKEENKEEAPAPQDALPSTKKSKHDKVYREQKTLKHELSDGDEYIAKQVKERKKQAEEDKADKKIDKTEFSDEVKGLLKQFFRQSYYSDDYIKKMKYAKDLTGKFEQLRQLIKKGEDPVKVIQQSIDNCWHALHEYKDNSASKKNNKNDDDVEMQTLSGDDVLKELDRRRAKYGAF